MKKWEVTGLFQFVKITLKTLFTQLHLIRHRPKRQVQIPTRIVEINYYFQPRVSIKSPETYILISLEAISINKMFKPYTKS